MAEHLVWKGRHWLYVAALAALASGSEAHLNAQIGPTTTSAGWNQFSADISVRQTVVGSSGQLLSTPPPAVALRMTRTLSSTGWRTTLTLVRQDAPVITGADAPSNPFLVGRVEYDGDGTPPRFYNQLGQRVPGPMAADRSILATPQSASKQPIDWDAFRNQIGTPIVAAQSSAWIDDVIATPAKRSERRLAIEQRYGRTTARVNGLDRYLVSAGSLVSELLVRPDMAVPVELNQTEGNVLVGRILFGYEVRGDGTLVRKLLRAERAAPDVSGARSIVDVEMTNVVARAGAAQ